MSRIALILSLVLAVCGIAGAQDTVGSPNSDGYTLQSSGYYTYGAESQLYYRSLVTVPAYTAYGQYYPQRQYYRYLAYNPPVVQVPPYQPNWQELVAKAIDRKNDYAAYLQAIKVLDPGGSYGINGAYGVQGSAYSIANFGVNGSTSYGVGNSFNAALATPYSTLDLNLLYQQAAQNTQSAIKLGADANNGFSVLVGQAGQGAANVAKIQAEGLAVAQVGTALFQALRSGQQYQGISFKLTPQVGWQKVEEPGKVDPNVKQGLAQQFAALAQARCVECHNATVKKGGFDIAAYASMSPQQKMAVWERLTTPDNDRVMPRDSKGGPGKRLTADELRTFFLN